MTVPVQVHGHPKPHRFQALVLILGVKARVSSNLLVPQWHEARPRRGHTPQIAPSQTLKPPLASSFRTVIGQVQANITQSPLSFGSIRHHKGRHGDVS